MEPRLLAAAREAIGFMPPAEGLALYRAALEAPPRGPIVEIGSYCGQSTIYLGAAAREADSALFTIDHHRGSEENQPGQQYHDPRLVDREGRVDTLPEFRATIARAGLEDVVVAIVADSFTAARQWLAPVAMLFIDGGHSQTAADVDYLNWTPRLSTGSTLAIHDVFPDPADGGRPPFLIYRRALDSGEFEETGVEGSLRMLRRR